jgi:hypothetical protein
MLYTTTSKESFVFIYCCYSAGIDIWLRGVQLVFIMECEFVYKCLECRQNKNVKVVYIVRSDKTTYK